MDSPQETVKLEKELGKAKLSMKGQVTIPKVVRVFLGIKPGDNVVFVLKDNEVVIRRESVF